MQGLSKYKNLHQYGQDVQSPSTVYINIITTMMSSILYLSACNIEPRGDGLHLVNNVLDFLCLYSQLENIVCRWPQSTECLERTDKKPKHLANTVAFINYRSRLIMLAESSGFLSLLSRLSTFQGSQQI